MSFETDLLVIGCGIAGATTALRAAKDSQRQVFVITSTANLQESNTRYAQGGIIGKGAVDSPNLLIRDILAAGAGLSLPSAVRILAEEGPDLVQRLLVEEAGVEFERSESRFRYTLALAPTCRSWRRREQHGPSAYLCSFGLPELSRVSLVFYPRSLPLNVLYGSSTQLQNALTAGLLSAMTPLAVASIATSDLTNNKSGGIIYMQVAHR